VPYYERIGLLGSPARTVSGYRDYGEDSATLLLFVHRARKMGLACDQVAELLPVWGGGEFAAAFDQVRATLEASPPPAACRTDLSCCVPSGPVVVPIELTGPSHQAGRRRAFEHPGRTAVQSG
jgi:DNA-binding transcriptional MerR regulator